MSPAADQLARAVARNFDLGPPPIDIEGLSSLLGIDEIVEGSLVEDGRLDRTDGSARIVVRAGVSSQRRRFTIAHELCHLLLTDHTSDLEAARHIIGENEEERFCEDFAAALLLPWSWIRAVAHDRPQTLHTLRIVAGRSNTSLAAACVRLNEVVGWRRTLLHWRRNNHEWSFRWAAGLPAGFEGRIRSASRTASLFDELDHQGDVPVAIPIRIGREEREVSAQVSVRHGSALVLAELK